MADVICLGELLIDFVPTVTGTGLTDDALRTLVLLVLDTGAEMARKLAS